MSFTWAHSSGLPDGVPSIQHVEFTTQLDVSNLAERVLDPTVHDTDKDVKQPQSQYQPLRNAIHHWSLHLAIDPVMDKSQAY